MRRFVLPVAVGAFVVLAALSAPASVEVFTKTPTKLYDAQGKVIEEVTAGYPFEADKAQGKWVYGFVKRKGGGRRGFIPLDDLLITDDNRRALNIPITTGRSAEPVLLRYKLPRGETQAYEETVGLNMKMTGRDAKEAVDITVSMQITLGHTLVGVSGPDEGEYAADMAFHKLSMIMDMRQNGTTVRITGNEKGATATVNGEQTASGPWDSGGFEDMADMGRLTTETFRIKVNDRGSMTETSEIDAILGENSFGGLSGALQPLLPKNAVRGGDTWDDETTVFIDNPGGGRLPLEAKAHYTLFERADYQQRPCARVLAEITGRHDEPGSDMRLAVKATGIQYVDEATGIVLRADGAGTVDVAVRAADGAGSGKIHFSMSSRYTGNRAP